MIDMKPITVPATSLDWRQARGLVLCQDVFIQRDGRRLNLLKGRILAAEDIEQLRQLGDRELHLLELEPGDVHEDTAAIRIGRAVAGPGLETQGPAESQLKLVASQRGVLEIRVDVLQRINALPLVGVFTLYDGQVVEEGKKVAGVKVAPLAVPESVVAAAEAICDQAGPIIMLHPFRPLRVATLNRQRMEENRRRRHEQELIERINWLGGQLTLTTVDNPDQPEAVARAIREQLEAGADLIIVVGTNSVDPLDAAVQGLLAAGGELIRQGMPAHPGSTYWLARAGQVPVLGLSSCGMFSHATVFDILLPRFFAGLAVDADFLASLGHGGLLTSDTRFRFPPYGQRTPSEKED